MDRGAVPWSAMRRARFVVGTAIRRDYLDVPNGVLMLDEGPVNYLVNVGGYGPGWDGWETILMPDPREVDVRYVFLHATAPETEQRFVTRARKQQVQHRPHRQEGHRPRAARGRPPLLVRAAGGRGRAVPLGRHLRPNGGRGDRGGASFSRRPPPHRSPASRTSLSPPAN
jgi:hypothetical protein